MNEPSSIHEPPELEGIVAGFVAAVLKSQPNDIYEFSANYFKNLAKTYLNRDEQIQVGRELASELPLIESLEETPASLQRSRRVPIIPEYYNPEEDTDFEDQREIYPKTDEERDRLRKSLAHLFLFSERTVEEIAVVMDALRPIDVKAGDVIIKEGDEGDLFYVIQSGKFEAVSKGALLKTYDGTGSFGELALLYDQPRSASVIAQTDGKLWCIDRKTFRRSVTHVAYDRKKQYLSFVNNVPLFKELTEKERNSLVDALKTQSYRDGSVIIQQGDEADCMYFVVEGEVDIKLTQNEVTKTVKVCRKGDYFGELALITRNPRAASAYARGDTVVASVDVDTFERVLGKCIDLMKRSSLRYSVVLQEAFGEEAVNICNLR